MSSTPNNSCGCSGSHACDCCTGPRVFTPRPIHNAPGQTALQRRAGDWDSFSRTMQARLSEVQNFPALQDLTTREPDDPSIAFLDAAAVVGDVLTFYNERLSNEAYLRTASERRNLTELGKLIGYTPRPGVAASAWLAFTLDTGYNITIPAGTRVQSVPASSKETAQTFETSDNLAARAELNAMRPRASVPQEISRANVLSIETLWLKGTGLNLKAGDMLLFAFPADKDATTPSTVNTVTEDSTAKRTAPRKVHTVTEDATAQRTAVRLEVFQLSAYGAPVTRQKVSEIASDAPVGAVASSATVNAIASGAALKNIVSGITLLQPAAPDDPMNLERSLDAFVSGSDRVSGVASDAVSRLAGRLAGSTDDELFAAWSRLNTGASAVEVYAMRVVTNVFGAGAPMRFGAEADKRHDARFAKPYGDGDWRPADDDLRGLIRLDGEQSKVVRDSYLVIERPLRVNDKEQQSKLLEGGFIGKLTKPAVAEGTDDDPKFPETLYTRVHRAADVLIAPHSAYSLSGKATTVKLGDTTHWGYDPELTFGIIRRARVYAASELLTLAEVPVDRVVGLDGTDEAGDIVHPSANPFAEGANVLMLDRLYQGLEPGHRIIVSGERTGDYSVRPVQEYALVSHVEHALIPAMSDPLAPLAGDTPHTRITLSEPLQYDYKRSTVTVFGNVAQATHGETKRETLGGGNARLVNQRFELRSVPVTHTAAATATGAESSVVMRVDKVQWRAVTQFIESGPDDRVFTLEIRDDRKTYAVFGDGKQGARLPTGVENVTAQYRQGLGRDGNVRAESLSTLLDRPLGLKSVLNPLAASGGAGRDEAEDIRYNAPLPLLALDRLVSVSDYAAFARAYAGIGKAEAALLGGAGGAFVHVTIAGQDDADIAEDSALMAGLTGSLVSLGDPLLAVRVQSRELLVLMLAVRVRIAPDHAWADVEPALRAAVLAAFGFKRRQPGQDVFLSEVVAVLQRVPGVDFVDVDAFAGVPEKKSDSKGRRALTPEELGTEISTLIPGPPQQRVDVALAGFDENAHLRPAQLALFLADLPETLVLNQFVS